MKTTIHFRQFECVAKQGGSMPVYWSAISLSNNDRTPESSGSTERTV
jgi:hypothetical protein